MKKRIVVTLILTSGALAAEKMTTVYKVTKLSPTEISVYCNNGGDPTGRNIGDTLIISCGK